MYPRKIIFYCLFFLFNSIKETTFSQDLLPPIIPWNGKSEGLVANSSNSWITPAEQSAFRSTPGYSETIQWLKKLDNSSPLIHLVPIGKGARGNTIYMVVASKLANVNQQSIKNSSMPLLLVQAGIHAGEIDGKDAGLMLLRDIAFGGKQHLLNGVNLLFIPILNVDGHERTSPYNRPNQRGPDNMGWRTNAQNLNLNRDYTKLDTREIRAVVKVINDYHPLLYIDLHVTDGADYQYDITFGGIGRQGYSAGINDWLTHTFKPQADQYLQSWGHIPGPLLFAVNNIDFKDGNAVTRGGPRFSDSYGDLRHMATLLVENHSLKPYKQRVLGTYILLEGALKILAKEEKALKKITQEEEEVRTYKLPLAWAIPQLNNERRATSDSAGKEISIPQADSLQLLGIESIRHTSEITHQEYVEWTGKPISISIPDYKATQAVEWINRPKGYYIPAEHFEIIERLRMHGIKMNILTRPVKVSVEMYRISDVQYFREDGVPTFFEGHIQVNAKTTPEIHTVDFAPGSAYISTNQPLGDLAIVLLEPRSPDSFFSWGFFMQIFQRTEYIEPYVMEPMITRMLNENPALKKEFDSKKAGDKKFAENPNAIFSWFYSKTKYYDSHYLLYPVARDL